MPVLKHGIYTTAALNSLCSWNPKNQLNAYYRNDLLEFSWEGIARKESCATRPTLTG